MGLPPMPRVGAITTLAVGDGVGEGVGDDVRRGVGDGVGLTDGVGDGVGLVVWVGAIVGVGVAVSRPALRSSRARACRITFAWFDSSAPDCC